MPGENYTIDVALTGYSQGLYSDLNGSLGRAAGIIAPDVPIMSAKGRFEVYGDGQDFQIVDTKRARGGDRKRLSFGAGSSPFDAQPHGLEIDVDDWDEAREGEQFNRFLQGRIKILISSGLRSHTKEVYDYADANTTALSGKGNWTNTSKDPIDEINEQIELISIALGGDIMPNRLTFSLRSYRLLIANAKMKEIDNVSREAQIGFILKRLINPNIQIDVVPIAYDARKKGAASSSKSAVLGASVYLHYTEDAPDEFDASWMKNFVPDYGGGPTRVGTYREKELRDVYFLDWAKQLQITNAAAAVKFAIT